MKKRHQLGATEVVFSLMVLGAFLFLWLPLVFANIVTWTIAIIWWHYDRLRSHLAYKRDLKHDTHF